MGVDGRQAGDLGTCHKGGDARGGGGGQLAINGLGRSRGGILSGGGGKGACCCSSEPLLVVSGKWRRRVGVGRGDKCVIDLVKTEGC